jgi:hypothetical protein
MSHPEKRTCVLLSHEGSYEGLTRALETTHLNSYQRVQTPAGTRLLHSTGIGPHVALLRQDAESIKKDLAWIEAQWHPACYVSTGTNLVPSPIDPGAPILVPTRCFRSVSRPEAEVEYVLYDEFDFDTAVREKLLAAAPKAEAQNALLFSGPKNEISNDELLWVHRKLGCTLYDNFSGELMNVARRFSSKVGCVRFLQGQQALERYWSSFRD